MTRYAILALAALATRGTATHAGFIITFEQQGSNVVANGSGTINTTGLTYLGSVSVSPELDPKGALAVAGSAATDNTYTGSITGPSDFGTGNYIIASSGSGNLAGFGIAQIPEIFVPSGYISGSALSDSATWDSATIASLGLAPGTYTYTWGTGSMADSFVVQIGPASVPEPSSFILLGVVAAFGFIAYRWRRQGSVPA